MMHGFKNIAHQVNRVAPLKAKNDSCIGSRLSLTTTASEAANPTRPNAVCIAAIFPGSQMSSWSEKKIYCPRALSNAL